MLDLVRFEATAVEETVRAPRLVRFGTFEVDLQAGELRKSGLKLRLTGQPFQVLAILLERPGEVVPREELQKRLWLDTFVDVDHNLNTAINKIREVLGDSAESPRFVETLPRRGYRFIAPVEGTQSAVASADEPASGAGRGSQAPSWGGAVAAKTIAGSLGESQGPSAQIASESATGAGVTLEPRPKRRGVFALVAIALVAIVILYFRFAVPLPPPRVSGYAQVTNDGRAKAWPGVSYDRLVTDGSRLYYIESPFVSPILKQVSTLGGETSAISTPFLVGSIGDISPDRSSLLVPAFVGLEIEDDPLWVLALPAGTPRRLGELLGGGGTWSPDGQRMFFTNGHDLYVARADGTESKRLASLPGDPYWLSWSPDGSRLRLSVFNPNIGPRLWEVQADGSHPHPLLPGWNNTSTECCGSWTPDGKYFIFQSNHNGKEQIWAIPERVGLFRRARGEPTELTTGPLSYVSAVPSLDGKKLFAIGSQPRGELGRFNQKTQQFEPYLSGISADGVDFSKDGQWVTYVSYPEGSLWRSKADGSERLQLTFPPMQVILPRWSPDKKQIAFTAMLPGRPAQNYLVSANGRYLAAGSSRRADGGV